MQPSRATGRVPAPDMASLWAEGPGTPMHVGIIAMLDGTGLVDPAGRTRLDAVREHVAARADQLPELRRVLVRRGLLGASAWQEHPSLDIRDHVQTASCAAGLDVHSFRHWCAQRCIEPLDRNRPLWRLEVSQPLRDGRVGMLLVAHHVLVDGLRGVALLERLLGPVPAEPVPPRRRATRRPDPGTAPTATDRVCGAMRRDSPTSLRGPLRPGRRVAVVHRSLDGVRASAHAHGATVDDLLLAAVTHGVRHLLLQHGEPVHHQQVTASVPVGARGSDPGGVLLVRLPVGEPDPVRRIAAVHAQKRQGRPAGAPYRRFLSMPGWAVHAGMLVMRRYGRGFVTVYVTDVPGPARPLYLAGARVLELVPLGPLVAGVRVSIAALSYDGSFVVSVQGDGGLADLSVLADGIRYGFGAFAPVHPARPAGTVEA